MIRGVHHLQSLGIARLLVRFSFGVHVDHVLGRLKIRSRNVFICSVHLQRPINPNSRRMSQGNSAQGVDVAFSPLSLKNCNELWDSRHIKCLMYLVSFDIGLSELSSLVHCDENTFETTMQTISFITSSDCMFVRYPEHSQESAAHSTRHTDKNVNTQILFPLHLMVDRWHRADIG